MSNILSNTTGLQEVLEALQNKAAGGGEQITPTISVNSSNGLVTATAGAKSSTYQLAFQAAKTITPNTTSQIAVSSGYYTGGNITVAAVPTQSKTATPTTTAQTVTPDSGKFLSKVTVNAIPSTYIQPSGTKTITENGTYDIKSYESATVNVASSGGGSGELVDYSEAEDAMVTGIISTYTNDRVTIIGNYAFAYCSTLTSVSFPVCTTIGNNAFTYCSTLTAVSFPVCTTISNNAFGNCSTLTSVSFPVCTTIGNYAFGNCSTLTSVSFPVCTTIGNNAFCSCRSLTAVSFPVCTTIGINAFSYCSTLTSVSFPICTIIDTNAFYSCRSLTAVSFPVCTNIRMYAFGNCSSLTSATFGKGIPSTSTTIKAYIYSMAFSSCSKLTNLTLYYPSVATLSKADAFYSTPMSVSTLTGSFGSIYVPASLVDAYKSATNWATYADRITAIPTQGGTSGGAD